MSWFESQLHQLDSCVTEQLTFTSLSLCALIYEMKGRNLSFLQVTGRIKCEVAPEAPSLGSAKMNALLKKGGKVRTHGPSLAQPSAREKPEDRPGASPLCPKGSPEQGQWRGEVFVGTARDAARPPVSSH